MGGRRGGSAELLSEKAAVECRQQGNPDTHQGVLLRPWGPLRAPGVRPLQMPEQPLNGGDGEADRPRTGLAPGRDAAWAALPHEARRPHGIPPSRRLPALRRSLAREATDSTLHPRHMPRVHGWPRPEARPWEQRHAPSPLTGEAEAAENPTEPGSRSRARPGCRRAWAKLAAGRAPGPCSVCLPLTRS